MQKTARIDPPVISPTHEKTRRVVKMIPTGVKVNVMKILISNAELS